MKKLLAAVLVCLVAFASQARAGEDVTLYATNSEDSIQVILETVKKQAPDLHVNVIRGKTGVLLQRVVAEKDAPSGDVFWSSGFGTLASYADMAESYKSEQGKTVPESLHGPDGKWLGTNVHVVVLMVNKDQLKGEAPKGWDDVLNGSGDDRIAFADPSASSSAYLQLYGIYKKYGEEGVKKLAKRVTVTGGSSSVYKGVAQGEYPIGITIEYAAYRYVAGGQRSVELVYPEEGTFLSPEGMFVIKGAPHSENAKKLFDVMMSKEAQETIFEKNFRRPTRSDVDVSAFSALPNMKDIKVFPLDQQQAGAEKDKVIKIWKEALASK
jgi:iron(III) transport system substrate-binding protein